VRQPELAERQSQIDLLRDADGVLQGFRIVREELGHLRGTAHVQLRVVDHLEPVGSVDGFPLWMQTMTS